MHVLAMYFLAKVVYPSHNLIKHLGHLIKLHMSYNRTPAGHTQCLPDKLCIPNYQDIRLCVSSQESRAAHKYVIYRNR